MSSIKTNVRSPLYVWGKMSCQQIGFLRRHSALRTDFKQPTKQYDDTDRLPIPSLESLAQISRAANFRNF